MKKTKKLLAGVSSSALVLASLAACGTDDNYYNQSPSPVPQGTDCEDWEWEADEGVWECDDRDSSYFGYYYFGSRFFKTKSRLKASPSYKSYKSSPSYKGSTRSSGGFGSGSRSSGG